MTTLYETAYAKINLTLDILGKRPDGYRDLKSVFQGISLRDDIEIDVGTGQPWQVDCGNGIPCDERNLAWKAAAAFCSELNQDPNGLTIRITKRIPSEAGMGGGSADAAAVLKALNRHYGYPLSIMELADLGARVGSDVPFCVLLGTAMVEGRGERLRSLPPIPDCRFVIAKPDFPVSTPALFRVMDSEPMHDRPDNDAMEEALKRGDLKGVCAQVCNVFDPVVARDHPEIDEIKNIFRAGGALACQMTGSGSACFAVTDSQEAAERICVSLREKYPNCWIARPV